MVTNSEDTALHPIGKLYGQWAFNFMVDIAGALAYDVRERPQRYQHLRDELSRILSGFRSSLGSHPDWPDAQQRIAIFRSLSAACFAGGSLRAAAVVFAEAATEVNRGLLLDTFRDAAQSFRNQMKTVEGQSLEIGCRQISTIFKNAIQLFQSDAIMGAFGLAPAPEDEDWPLTGYGKSEGTNLATELIRVLDSGNLARALLSGPKRDKPGAPPPTPIRISMTQNKFILLQQAAWYGAQAISGIMAGSDRQEDLLSVVGHTYKWTKALLRLIPDVARAWKDPEYRWRLTDLEWGMVEPHPSEAINLALTSSPAIIIGRSTYTINDEACCCTGDMECPSSSNCQVTIPSTCANCGTFDCLEI